MCDSWFSKRIGAGCLALVCGLALVMRFEAGGGTVLPAAEPAAADKSLSDELPRIPAVEPQKALATFKLEKGFELQLVASEPNVMDPVDACFDENGRMYVAEMQDYPYSPEPRPQCPEGVGRPDAGVVRLLQDVDGDGIYEHSTKFADKISWPTSVVCYRGGVFVVAAPHVHYFKDTDGDGIADVREIVYSGFGRQNVQGLVNNFKWGLDNHIHGAGGLNGGQLTHRGEKLLTLAGGQLVRIDPATEKFETLSGGSQFGHSFDDWGNRFVCSNSNHIQQVVLPHQYLVRNPYLAVPEVTRTISKEGGASPVFRRSQAEPWRLVRTRRRASDPEMAKRLPPSELVPIGFFTSATGVTIYRGGAYPPEYQGQVFIGDVGGNLVHRKTLTPVGAAFVATRANTGVEFLTSTDNWFRPANFVNAPDGTLYFLDMYRETIEHPFSIPEDIKKHLDLESGHDRGRIYRLVAPKMQHVTPPKLGSKSGPELVAELESPHSWNRETAQRLLWERQEKSAIEPLRKLATISKSPLGRLHALWTLDGLNGLNEDVLLTALGDAHPGVREHAVRLSEKLANQSPKLVEKLGSLTADDAYRVRFQLALSLGEVQSPQAVDGLVQLARRDAGDADMRTAWLSSVTGKEAGLLTQLLADSQFRQQPAAATLLAQLAGVAGAQKDAGGIGKILAAVAQLRGAAATQEVILKALGDGLSRRGTSIPGLLQGQEIEPATRAAVTELFRTASVAAVDDKRPPAEREAAIGLLAYADFALLAEVAGRLLTPQTPPPLQLAVVRALSVQGDPQVGALLLDNWSGFSPAVRHEVVEALVRSIPRLELLFAGISAGKVKPGELERDKKQLLLNHPNDRIRTQARKLLGGEVASNRAKVVADYQAALKLEGNAQRGQAVFQKNCAVCHQVGELGKAVGPNLASTQNKTPADLLLNILDPNREALPAYTNYTVETDQGKILSGIIAAESATSITLRRAEAAQDVVLRANIAQMIASGVSLMPEGLEKDISPAQMADLIEFVRAIKPDQK